MQKADCFAPLFLIDEITCAGCDQRLDAPSSDRRKTNANQDENRIGSDE
jgi:hypothetical protein